MIRKFLSMCLIAIVIFSVGTAMAYDPPARDLGGQTITMYSWDLRAPSEGHVYHDNMLATQEKFNIKVQYGRIPWENLVSETVAGVLAGKAPGELVELMIDDHALPLIVQGALHPLEDVAAAYYDALPGVLRGQEGAGLKEALTLNGHVWGLAPATNVCPTYMSIIIVWNKALFEAENLPSLYELMESKEWTWDKMREIAQKATRDTDGDGVIDQWGIGGQGIRHYQRTIASFAVANNASPVITVDGKVKADITNPDFVAAVEFMAQLHADNVTAYDGGYTLFNQGKVAMDVCHFWEISQYQQGVADVGIAYIPLGPKGTEYSAVVTSIPIIAIPATVPDPAAMVDVWASLHPITEEYLDAMVESFAAERATDINSYELIREMFYNWRSVASGPVWGCFAWPVNQAGWDAISNAVTSPAAAMEQWQPQIQAALDDILRQ